MIVDCHVHICAFDPAHGRVSPKLLKTIPFRLLRRMLGIRQTDASADPILERKLADTIAQTKEIDAAVVLAFDAVYTRDGQRDEDHTHLFVSNDYVRDLAARNPRMLFGASINPLRHDAIAELERCIRGGAVLIKWLPIVQGFDPSDPRCCEFYEAMAHHRMPLLSHTGAENALPKLRPELADPALLKPALRRGVKVIMAHCGSRLLPWENDYVDRFMEMAREFEHCYGDTSALNVPNRWYALRKVLRDPIVRTKLVHGSDWPIVAVPPLSLGLPAVAELMMNEPNLMRRDVLIKQKLGMDDEYFRRAATVLRLDRGTERAA